MKLSSRRLVAVGAAAFLAGAVGLTASADTAVTTQPFVIPHGQKDIGLAPSGTYTLDPNHVGVIARVSHVGFSLSVFRFDRASATLEWNHDAPTKSKLKASVEVGSITTNVAGFAAQLAGDKYLNASKYPAATFVSSAFHQLDATHGKVDGEFTLMGRT